MEQLLKAVVLAGVDELAVDVVANDENALPGYGVADGSETFRRINAAGRVIRGI